MLPRTARESPTGGSRLWDWRFGYSRSWSLVDRRSIEDPLKRRCILVSVGADSGAKANQVTAILQNTGLRATQAPVGKVAKEGIPKAAAR